MSIDKMVGEVVPHAISINPNTLFIFTSDNGHFNGEHRLGNKYTAHEESIKVPLYIRAPGQTTGKQVTQLVSNADLAPTILDYAGISWEEKLDGRSLKPLLEGVATSWRNALLIQHKRAFPEKTPQSTDWAFGLPDFQGLRVITNSIDELYVHYKDAKTPEYFERYDMKTDKYQQTNLANGIHQAYENTINTFANCKGNSCRTADVYDGGVATTPPATNKQITFSAKGKYSGGAWPQLELRIKNSSGAYQSVKTFTIDSASYKNFTYTHTVNLTADQVRLAFINDSGPRDVWVDYLKIGNTTYQTEAPTTYSTGTWNSNAGNCDAYYPQSEVLHCNGEFHFLKNVELLQSTRVNIVAKGVFGNNAWPLLEVWIKNSKGVYEKKQSISINSSTYKTFSYDHPVLFDASQVRLKLVNDNGPRDVQVQSIKFGTATYPTNAYGTYSTGSWNSSTKKCTAGYPHNNSAYPTRDTLACNGYFDFYKR